MALHQISYQDLAGEEYSNDGSHSNSVDDSELLDTLCGDLYQEETTERVLKALPEIERGDVIHVVEMGEYRNEGKVMWDGKRIIPIGSDDSIDDYGHVPNTFLVGDEFDTHHWRDSIDHNDIVWVDVPKHREELLANLTPTGTFFTGAYCKIKINL